MPASPWSTTPLEDPLEPSAPEEAPELPEPDDPEPNPEDAEPEEAPDPEGLPLVEGLPPELAFVPLAPGDDPEEVEAASLPPGAAGTVGLSLEQPT